jgi:hypothetical protein
MNRISGYDPETGICWQFHNKGDNFIRCKCPVCSVPWSDRLSIWFGRCRSGKRWFWKAYNFSLSSERHHQTGVWEEIEEHSFEETEEAAWAALRDAVIRLADKRPAVAAAIHGVASDGLKALNTAKRAARPAPDTSDAHVVEYLYGHTHGEITPGSPVRFRIAKKTTKRVFYIRHEELLDAHGEPRRDVRGNDYGIGYVNRQKLEADGSVYNHGVHWCRSDFHLYTSFEGLMGDRYREPEKPNLHRLKAEMAAAHPDRGGSNTALIAARARYVAARRQLRVQPRRGEI